MKRSSPNRFWAIGLALAALAIFCVAAGARAEGQADQSATAQLLGKAHALEVRGRVDMAKQMWQQVLLVDPNNTEALAGMARAEKLEGHPEKSNEYLSKLQAINPNDPNIARIQTMGTAQDQSVQLQEAGRLAQAGQYERAMAVLRQVYGDNPPPGDAALSYYQTEAASPEGQPAAIAGLRALVDKYPQDPRYQIALGKILTYNPRTRPEGRRLLEKYPSDPEASEALRQSLLWDAKNPAMAGDIRAYLATHNDQQLAADLAQDRARGGRQTGRAGVALTPEQQAALATTRARGAEEQAAYNALAAHHIDDAEAKFKAILANNPQNMQALAGLGYVRMAQSNFGGAISYFEQAKLEGSRDPAVDRALNDSRYYYTMQQATTALNANDLATAQQQFAAAEQMHPRDTDPLLGLGGTLLKAQQPEAAIPVFAQYVKMKPEDEAAWRGLFMAQYGAGKYNAALATDQRVPARVKAELLKDPDYLRTLAAVDSAVGRDADAQRVLRNALNLPFPAGAKGLKSGVQLQYAALLAAANRPEQAIELYQQALAADPTNTSAYVGLIQSEHQAGHDAAAYQTIQSMPPEIYASAMQDPGFETTVAAVYGSMGHPELAQDVLEKFLAKEQAEGKPPSVSAQIQLAGIYLEHGNSAQAYPLYSSILQYHPDRADAWDGLLSTLHATGHDREALAQLEAMPPAVRQQLESDPAFLETVGSIYAGLGQPQEAMVFYNRVEQHYAAQHVAPPADVDIQEAWLLYNSRNDAGLYRQLMEIGGRTDLTDQQRLTVQTIWTNWAVRRADQASARGDYRRAIAILNATATTFPGNPKVITALASGYASAGMAKEAVAIFRSQDLTQASAADYKAAIGAALAANDLGDAETWLRFGLEQYPRDARMLVLAAKFEQARGDATRAAEYYRASLAQMPAPNPGAELAGELSHPAPQVPAQLPSRQQPQDLATLLSQPDATSRRAQQPVAQPYLPSYNGAAGEAPVQVTPQGGGYYGGGAIGAPENGGYVGSNPASGTPAPPPSPTLKDYSPQSRLEIPSRHIPSHQAYAAAVASDTALHLHPSAAMEARYGPYVSYNPAEGVPHFVAVPAAGPATGMAGSAREGGAVTMVAAAFEGQQATAPDGTPIVSYVPNARVPSARVTRAKPAAGVPISSRPESAAAARARAAAVRAALIRANQSAAPEAMTGQSHPPVENYDTESPAYNPGSQVQNVQFSAQPYGAGQTQAQQGQAGYGYSTSQDNVQNGNGYGQQYPQPNTRGTSTATRRVHRRVAPQTTQTTIQAEPAQPEPAPAPAPMAYPNYAPPLTGSSYPQVGSPYPLGQAPSDYQLQQENLPPLRGYFDPRVDNTTPLTERQQTELDLASIEGSYSGWLGGSVIGRYRSGTPGIDRLAALSAPFEASVVGGNALRLTVIAMPVFLDSGLLTTGNLGSNPVLGTVRGDATGTQVQQFASGVGGEVQLATNTFSAAVGVTPYEFLVTNMIGRVQWKPANGHFTLYGGRDPVEETQLSYAGLRDPGQASIFASGPVWGGVVQTGGGVRFDAGNEKAGLYIDGEGADLTGYHVLENQKFDGTMGAYFLARKWPEYGSLTVGGMLYGMHFEYNERPETYGLGGYFSPEAYFLAAVPVSFIGHYGTAVHYTINGAVGIQTFQEDNQIYFPLDPILETDLNCTNEQFVAQTCGQQPVNSNTGLNFSINSEVSYQVNEHWFVGGFLSANNTNNYDTVQGGFFARYLFRPQYSTADYPTGLFPVEGLRPLRVP